MKKVAFIAFSDLHAEDWKRFSVNHSRLNHNFEVLKIIKRACTTHETDNVLFAGDFFDNPSGLTNLLITNTFKTYRRTLAKKNMIAISGNHDQSEMNTPTNPSPSHLQLYDEAFKNFNLLDHRTYTMPGFKVFGVPYLKNNVGFEEAVKDLKKGLSTTKQNILLVHTDFHNIQYDNQRSGGITENLPRRLGKLFKGFDLVLSGHIHKPQVIRKNIVMLGATHHQRISDRGVEMGYWLIYDDLSYKFIPITTLPQFKYGDKPDGKNFIVPRVKDLKTEAALPEQAKFKSTNVRKLSKNYLKAKGVKDTRKLDLLEKYLSKGQT